MSRAMRALLLGVLAVQGARPTFADAPPRDEAAIRQVQAEQEAAWNRHDAGAYANLFTEDGDCVNVLGWWWKGRPQIESRLTAAFSLAFRDSTLTLTDVQIKFLSPNIAVAHVRWTMTGYHFPTGMPEPREGIEVQTLAKVGNRWLIASFQNTIGIPERPFPTGPAPGPASAAPTN